MMKATSKKILVMLMILLTGKIAFSQAPAYNVYITNFKGENATKVAYKDPLCLVIGSEGTGVSPAIFKFGTQVTIPQRSQDISYNASVAAGIMLFLVSQR